MRLDGDAEPTTAHAVPDEAVVKAIAGVIASFTLLAACGTLRTSLPDIPGIAAPPAPGRKLVLMASWYGTEFHGARTASGEHFDARAFTAAHPTFPFGTVLRVRNPRTGSIVVVTVNDRGPFVRGRDLDLSHAAARELDIVADGVSRVEVEVIERPAARAVGRAATGALGEPARGR